MRWVRAGSEQMMWPKLGWFSAAICVGSALGAAAWAAQMLNFSLYYESNAPGSIRSQSYALLASALKFDATFVVLYGFEFLCLIIAKLLLLGRLASNATRISSHEVSSGVRHMRMTARVLPNVYRVMSGVVVAGSVVGAVASVVDGVYQVRSAGLTEQAAGACDAAGNDTNSSISFNAAAIISRSTARTANSVQSGSEAFTLLAVSLAFLCSSPSPPAPPSTCCRLTPPSTTQSTLPAPSATPARRCPFSSAAGWSIRPSSRCDM